MDLKLSDEEASLQGELRDWLDENYAFADVLARTASAQSRDESLWRGLVDGGWIERALPRRDDLQQSTIDAAIVAEEFGRSLVVEPFLRSGYLSACLILEAAAPAEGDELISGIARGRHRYAAALYEPDSRFWLNRVDTRASEVDGEWHLTGRKAMVLDGADADRLIVSARTHDGTLGLFLVTGDAAGMSRTRFHTIDAFDAADIVFDGCPAIPISMGDEIESSIQSAVDRTITVLGAEATGAAEAAVDETAAYAGKREQFGRPIAQFQVIGHRLARMFIELEGLRGGLVEALSLASATAEERAQAAAALKVLIANNGRFVVNQGIQVHGGVGTIETFKVSHCFKRVFAIETLFGNGDFHLDRYAGAMA